MSIGQSAFASCASLTSITVDANNQNYASENSMLYNKVKTTLIQVPSGMSGSITIPASVTSIGSFAFSGCTGLTSITIPASVTSIGHWTFYGCTGLTSITIPASVTSIGDFAFNGCTGLTSIIIPASVTSIGMRAFSGCTGLTSATFATGSAIGNTNFGEDAFPLGNNLREAYLETSGGAGTYTRASGGEVWAKQP